MNIHFLSWQRPQNIELIAQMISNGKVFAGTSDTILGLLAQATPAGAYALDTIKGRSKKPYIVLIQNPDFITLFSDGTLPEACSKLIKACWPGPLTIILPAKPTVPHQITGPGGTVALRAPKHDGLQALLAKVPALFSTSANISASPVPSAIEQIEDSITKAVAGIITDTQAELAPENPLPSTIIDCTKPDPRLIREGAYSVNTLQEICECKISCD